MKLKDLIAVCGAENITVAIPPSYFTKNKALYDLANRTRHTDAYGSFHREGTRGSKPVEGYITAVIQNSCVFTVMRNSWLISLK